MPGNQHTQRASKPAPRRYGTEANPLRLVPPNQDTPEATADRPSGELPRGASLNFPPAQSSASGELFSG